MHRLISFDVGFGQRKQQAETYLMQRLDEIATQKSAVKVKCLLMWTYTTYGMLQNLL